MEETNTRHMTLDEFVDEYAHGNVRVYNALKNAGLLTVDQVKTYAEENRCRYTMPEYFKYLKNFGPKSWKDLLAALKLLEEQEFKAAIHPAVAQVATMES